MMLPRPPSWTARLVGPALACLLLTGVGAHAQTQQITPDPPSQEAASGAALGIGVDYTASDRNPLLTGLGLRLHWNSARLTLQGQSDVLDTAKIGADTDCQDDTQTDYDADPQTDCFVQIAWASLPGQWPGSLPKRLLTAEFTSALTEGQSTAVNFSASATAVGYGFAATSAIVRAESGGDEEWPMAYARLFSRPSDLDLLRRYRDEVLIRSPSGRDAVEALYAQSGDALAVFLRSPGLLRQARALMDRNRSAVSTVLAGRTAGISDQSGVIAFLNAYADQAPPALQGLVGQVLAELDRAAASGATAFGFKP
ncbi:MAG: hypothetical protein KFB96_01595 [Thiocapsa sp.]|uniref:hypothetical protein n=1 Tax=Thiocapsa sp. TaxID=2024551 RepID=UPI001BD01345|nr:hypothetical protein [Thiocapsa sp.]QVL49250.1 MAG: hypothetical protein KFB96_01595 [Thiocapsa sp.]